MLYQHTLCVGACVCVKQLLECNGNTNQLFMCAILNAFECLVLSNVFCVLYSLNVSVSDSPVQVRVLCSQSV